MHRLTNVDMENRKADCSKCGRVSVHVKEKYNQRQCYYAHKYGANMQRKKKKQLKNCEICNVETYTFFDHCHVANEHRGWLCRKCNLFLGLAGDDIEKLRNAIVYLEQYKVQ